MYFLLLFLSLEEEFLLKIEEFLPVAFAETLIVVEKVSVAASDWRRSIVVCLRNEPLRLVEFRRLY